MDMIGVLTAANNNFKSIGGNFTELYRSANSSDRLSQVTYSNEAFYIHEFHAGIKWYADWPLRRRGPANVIPLKDHAFQDDTIFEIYNERSDSAGNRRVIRLKAGGSTRKEAVDNWMQTAQVIRNLL